MQAPRLAERPTPFLPRRLDIGPLLALLLAWIGTTACGPSGKTGAAAAPAPASSSCMASAGCPAPRALPVCSDEVTVVALARALDPTEISNGEPVAVEGVLAQGPGGCTRLGCTDGGCCNRCEAQVLLRGATDAEVLPILASTDGFACTGDESALCCTTELGVGRVRLVGNLRDRGGVRELALREACRIDETLLTNAGRTCLKERGCEPPAVSAGVCNRRKDEIYVGAVLDAPTAHAGKTLHLKGRIGVGPKFCTKMACAEGTCCNTCGARMTLGDDQDRTLELAAKTAVADGARDPFVCAGDDSWTCCKTFASGQLGVVTGTLVELDGRWQLQVDSLCDL